MPTGIVKVFYRSKGYGFIRPENEGRDVFVHRTVLDTAGLRELRKGQRVGFDLAEDQGRPFAKNLRLLDEENSERSSLALLSPPAEPHMGSVRDESDEPDRKLITRAALEQSLTDAVRRIAPECQAFVGLIVERVVPETPNGVNWVVKGVRYGKADRDRCQEAIAVSLQEKQQEYILTDDQAEFGNQF
jgi:cold shock CspA family protein